MSKIEIPTNAYPLAWPPGVPRCKARENARFHDTTIKYSEYVDAQGQKRTSSYRRPTDLTVASAREDVLLELQRLGAKDPVVLSTNMPLRADGLPRSDRRAPDDPGAAVYFVLGKVETCIAIDRYTRVADNLRAIAKTIEAMRGIERWGGAQLVAAAFQGFQGLPGPGVAPAPAPWHLVLGVAEDADLPTVDAAARALILKHHPDKGGSQVEFSRVVDAARAARAACSRRSA